MDTMNNLTDIHSHIMFGIDDGSRDIEESIELIKRMKQVGFKNIILTPHYINDSKYMCNNETKKELLDELKEELKRQDIDVNLYLGNEIYINKEINKLIDNGEVSTLAGNKYLLFEVPMHNKINNLLDIVYELKIKGYIPILAHPERYTVFKENYKEVDVLKEEGLLFQGNYASILGYYGKDSKKLFKYLLKKKYINYLGTDIHRVDKTFVIDNFEKINKKIKKITKDDYYNKIVENCNDIVRNLK